MAFLVFEGLDGSGKSTLIQKLAAHLQSQKIALQLTREPGGTELAEAIRNLLIRTGFEAPTARTEVLLYEASRAQHVDLVIRPALAEGRWILCDRFSASTVAFQCFARGLNRAEIDWLNTYATGGLQPDLTVLLDLPVEESLRRMQAREQSTGVDRDRFEREQREFHENVRRGFLAQAHEQSARWLVLDAMKSPDDLFTDLVRDLEKRSW